MRGARRKSSGGFSLFEVLVAVGVLAAVGIAVVGAVSHSAQEARTTSDYSLSLFLSQKVAEEAIQATFENPYVDASLGVLAGTRLNVADPFNPYFATLEDTGAPYGILTPGPDLSVDTRSPDLARLYRDYNLTLTTDNAPVNPPTPEQLSVSFDWPGLKNQPRQSSFPVLLARQSDSQVAVPLIAQDPPGLDAQSRIALFPPGGPSDLAGYVGSVNGNLSVARDIGGVVVVTAFANDDGDAIQSNITTMEAALTAGPDDPVMRVGVARLYEKRASIAWQTLLYAKDPAGRVATNLTAADLGGKNVPLKYFMFDEVASAARMRQTFDYDTGMALSHYVAARRLLLPLQTRAFWEYTIERKILELAELRVMSLETGDVTFVNQWIDGLAVLYGGRNRAISDFLAHEKTAAGSLTGIQNLHPVIRDRMSDMKVAETALNQLLARMTTQLF